MVDIKSATKLMDDAENFIQCNLFELCVEIREWHHTSILRNGKMRELAKMLSFTERSLPVAESMVNAAAMDALIRRINERS